jgi:hypothetical protein
MAPPGGVGVHGATPSTVFATGEAALSKTPLFSGHFGGAIAALFREMLLWTGVMPSPRLGAARAIAQRYRLEGSFSLYYLFRIARFV